ncbi:MAG: PaaI family thioesterase [Woeseiaceae bacterium]|nr:PaaI family thioesterase [Woeseiaceae bacterium]
MTPDYFNENDLKHLPGTLGIKVTSVQKGRLEAELDIAEKHLALNGYLHAGTIITLADSGAGYGCMANLPDGASGFTTIELKSNHLATATEGTIRCVSECLHTGRTTQVWESSVYSAATGKLLAKFTCTQLILYPRN